jgi:hypothetical protein
VNTSANHEIPNDVNPTWTDCRNEIFKNTVSNRFVKVALFTKRPEIELKRFKFDTKHVRDIANVECREIRLPRLGTHTGKFRALEANFIIPLRVRIGKSF